MKIDEWNLPTRGALGMLFKLKKVNGVISYSIIFLIGVLLLLPMVLAVSTPEGPYILSMVNSTRRTVNDVNSTIAEAGNITKLSLMGETITQTWAGFVGNVTGTITLDDQAGHTLYNWTLSNPEGEVYATYLPTINWTTGAIFCWNWSISANYYLQLGELEGWTNVTAAASSIAGYGYWTNLSLASDDVDGVNETFGCRMCGDGSESGAGTTHSRFYIGGQLISGSNTNSKTGTCPFVRTMQNNGAKTFEEVILYHNGTSGGNETLDGIIYTAILNQSATGYDGGTYDFQMIVGENGHDGDTTVTTYYFYVELE